MTRASGEFRPIMRYGKARERIAADWPLLETEYRKLHLSAGGTMDWSTDGSGTVEYDARLFGR